MKKTNLMLGMLTLLVATFTFVSADAEEGCAMYGMMSGSYGFFGMFFGWIFSLLVLIALVLLIIWLVKQIQKKK